MNTSDTSSLSERLRQIHWKRANISKRSYKTLIAEYLRRAAIWRTRLTQPGGDSPFFDLTVAIGANSSNGPEGGINLRIISSGNANMLEQRVCEWYIKWTEVPEGIRNTYSDMPDLYEPLIRLFERGGVLRTHDGFLEMGGGSMPLFDWQNRPHMPALDISDAHLDSLD